MLCSEGLGTPSITAESGGTTTSSSVPRRLRVARRFPARVAGQRAADRTSVAAGAVLGAVGAFAALVTLLARNGALTLLAALVWVAVEAAVLSALVRLPNFGISTIEGAPPPDAWLLDAFPLHGLTTIMQTVGRAATGLPTYPGEAFARESGVALVPIVSFTILIAIMTAASFRRFSRMDVIE